MKKRIFTIVIIVAALVAGFYGLNAYIYHEKQAPEPVVKDVKNAMYVVDGRIVRLVNGVSEEEAAPGSASTIVTRYFGNEVRSDLDGDGREDVAFILTQETGGSGIFYYVVAALHTETGYDGGQALFLGDRIAPQTTEKGEGKTIIVNYADRNPGESFTTPPSMGKSIRLLLDPVNMQFGEVVQDFEGEADPSRMTLFMKTWVWVSASMNDGAEVFPKKSGAFTLTFKDDGTFSLTTDCNSGGGSYTVTEPGHITFGPMFSTKMFCDGSQEAQFMRMVADSTSYHFSTKGELILDIRFDSGSVLFR